MQIEIPVKQPTLWITAGSRSTVYPAYYTKKRKQDVKNTKGYTQGGNPPL